MICKEWQFYAAVKGISDYAVYNLYKQNDTSRRLWRDVQMTVS